MGQWKKHYRLKKKKKETRQKFSVRKEKLCLSYMDSFKNNQTYDQEEISEDDFVLTFRRQYDCTWKIILKWEDIKRK